jgi:hypothetical protein
MIVSYNKLSAAAAILALFIFCCCKHDKKNAPSADANLSKLAGVWRIENATLSGADVTAFYADLHVTFNTDKSYACEHEVDPVWPVTGTFTLEYDDDDLILHRSDNVLMTIVSLSETGLILKFDWAGAPPSGGRTSTLSGEYIFTFLK